jgi:hypothetical protein
MRQQRTSKFIILITIGLSQLPSLCSAGIVYNYLKPIGNSTLPSNAIRTHNSVNLVNRALQINKCIEVFNNTVIHSQAKNEQRIVTPRSVDTNKITAKDLIHHTIKGIAQVPEFQFIKETAERMGVRVWLFGGTASSFLHYVKWDLARSRGLMNLQKDRFDYDYTNIFRSTQDLDIAIDATPAEALAFQKIIAEKYPQFLGAKAK